MLTQLGYALGLLFLVPFRRRGGSSKLIIRMAALSAISLLAAFLRLRLRYLHALLF